MGNFIVVLILKHTVLLRPLKSHQLTGLVHWPRSWLCSVSTVLAQNNFPASWPTSTFLLHQSGLDWTKFVPVGPACPVNLSIILPKAALILYHKFSSQVSATVYPAPLFSFPLFPFPSIPLPLSLSTSSCRVSLRSPCRILFLSSSRFPSWKSAKNFHLNSFLDSKR